MRDLDPGLAAALASGVTTLCRCWRLERTDGLVLGFTDHDRALGFEGVSFSPETGFTASEAEATLGLSRDNLEVQGALRSDAIAEADVIAGRWDGAEVTQWLVDWTDVSARAVIFAGRLGEARRGDGAFEATLEGLSAPLLRERGRAYARLCDAEVGDGRCKVALTGGLAGAGTVTRVIDDRTFAVSGLGGDAPGLFSLGRLSWTSGASAGEADAVREHRSVAGEVRVALWRPPSGAVEIGDAFTVTAGCDKTLATCRDRFDNVRNHRGFPHIPGEDWTAAHPRSDEAHDGGSLFR